MRAVARYSAMFCYQAPSRIPRRAHFVLRTVLAVSATTFSAAWAKHSLEDLSISMILRGLQSLLRMDDEYTLNRVLADPSRRTIGGIL